jgi:hypothetical protein
LDYSLFSPLGVGATRAAAGSPIPTKANTEGDLFFVDEDISNAKLVINLYATLTDCPQVETDAI